MEFPSGNGGRGWRLIPTCHRRDSTSTCGYIRIQDSLLGAMEGTVSPGWTKWAVSERPKDFQLLAEMAVLSNSWVCCTTTSSATTNCIRRGISSTLLCLSKAEILLTKSGPNTSKPTLRSGFGSLRISVLTLTPPFNKDTSREGGSTRMSRCPPTCPRKSTG